MRMKSAFVLDRGELFGWGNSEYGQLASDTDAQQINTPKYVQMAKACGKIVDIAAGGSFCLALNGIQSTHQTTTIIQLI